VASQHSTQSNFFNGGKDYGELQRHPSTEHTDLVAGFHLRGKLSPSIPLPPPQDIANALRRILTVVLGFTLHAAGGTHPSRTLPLAMALQPR
jgi:hypothetical protein